MKLTIYFLCHEDVYKRQVGILRPITLWPFPTKAIAAYADKVKGMLVRN